jgi:hypothetical protein
MTPRQTSAYWRAWGRVVRANRWSMLQGVLHPQATLATSDIHALVWQAAEARAAAKTAPVTADDLRHGCHIAALGRDKSSKDLGTGRDITRLFALFRLLQNPDDIAARIEWGDTAGAADSRRRMIHRIRTAAPQAYTLQICRDRFASVLRESDWESLPLPALRQLVMILAQRTENFRRPIT